VHLHVRLRQLQGLSLHIHVRLVEGVVLGLHDRQVVLARDAAAAGLRAVLVHVAWVCIALALPGPVLAEDANIGTKHSLAQFNTDMVGASIDKR